MAEFLVALSDFDRRRGWEALGHANLFSFLQVALGLSKSAAFYRTSAAELLQDFPEVIEPLREGRLCLSTIAELAKVLTEENRAVVASAPKADAHPTEAPPSRVLTSDFANGGGGRGAAKRDEIVPLTADVRRVHFNVGTQVVKKPRKTVAPTMALTTSNSATEGGAPTTSADPSTTLAASPLGPGQPPQLIDDNPLSDH